MADELTSRPMPPMALAGAALRALPSPLIERALATALGQLARRHPGLFERLEGYAGADIVIEAGDFAIGVRLWPGASPPRIELVADPAASPAPRARVSGPLAILVGLLEGRLDGDALFFSRDLAIEGDTELVVALRNAIESAEIDLVGDLLAPLAPLDFAARRVLGGCGNAMRRATRDLEWVRAMLGLPAPGGHDRLVRELRDLEDAVESLREDLGRLKAASRGHIRARP